MLPSLLDLVVKLQKQVDRISNVIVELKTILIQPKKVALHQGNLHKDPLRKDHLQIAQQTLMLSQSSC